MDDDQFYGLDMNGDSSRFLARGHSRSRGSSNGHTHARQAPSAVAWVRGRGRGRGMNIGQTANATMVNGLTSQRSAKNHVDSQASMDWLVPEHVSIVCSLFAEQVQKGNRPNTHLNAMGYVEVSSRFFQITGIELSKTQLRNKWEKLKCDLTAWRKLMRRQTGTGWDHLRQTIEMDPEWWRKIKAEIPGCAKFKKGPLQNEADLTKMFDKITNEENDHWNPMTENPIIPENHEPIINLEDDFADVECELPNEFASASSDVVQEVSPSVGNGKKTSVCLRKTS
ncbi:hypothetical protein Zm00014a_001014 [Zea mays]|uniref:Myb/SANT-like domain-containing protein n=1 Tax=Zea mays TaxID=4577 RepID=A0A3L6FFD7_MAIZE|nr:hypothetical protein Zm00014a_001014 [Zea mays]